MPPWKPTATKSLWQENKRKPYSKKIKKVRKMISKGKARRRLKEKVLWGN